MVRKVFNFLKNKFFLVTVAFIVWLLFFDQNNFLYQQKLNRQLKEMQIEKNAHLKQIKIDKEATQKLLYDSLTIEKFARETYLMKRDSEDIFLIIRDTVPKEKKK
ncbi:MAG TPA: septum formation inhibitor [Bacteroidales bacterium]|nr:septum formation inhibitor [Bacteroidales bacterium]HPT03695.1 septum formation inhibitor [Bacteroidales bacterium]